MSMLGSFFNRGFKASQCKTLMKLTIPRIKLLRNRREILLKQMRKEIAKLLETGQEATARIRIEHIIREENMMAAQEILELFCELIVVRLPIIESQKECPLDLKEAISSICFAAPRCADLSELQQVQLLFASKYGNEFVAAATELVPNCGVNRQLIELLSVRAPSPKKKLKFLKDIAVEHELDWDPAASETEFFKPHEDLLTDQTQFISGCTLPIPKEKHEAVNSAPDQLHKEQAVSDVGLDDLDFPEVPKVSVEATGNAIPVTPEAVPCCQIDDEWCSHSGCSTDLKEESYLKDEGVFKERVAANNDDPCTSLGSTENKQFLPFISPPSVSNAFAFSVPNASYSATSDNSPPTHSWKISEAHVDLQDVLAATQAAAETDERAEVAAETSKRVAEASGHSPPSLSGKKGEAYVDLQDVLAVAQSAADTVLEAEAAAEIAKRVASTSSNTPSTLYEKKSEANVDLQDILAAAQAATDTAERAEAAAESAKHAAAAARSAASLAQARISELTKSNGANVFDSSCENPFHGSTCSQHDTTESTHFNGPMYASDEVFRNYSAPPQGYGSSEGLEASHVPSFDKLKADFDSSLSCNHTLGNTSVSHQPKRLPSMDDETYFSYPNLFTSQISRGESHSPSETGRFTHDL